MIQDAELVIIGLSLVILLSFFIGWLVVKRVNKKIDEEQGELEQNQLYAQCSCGFRELYDKRVKTITECPQCGAKAEHHKSNISAG